MYFFQLTIIALMLFSPQIASPAELEIGELLEALKVQLKLLETSAGKKPTFSGKEAKLRVQFVLIRKGEAGFKAAVVTAGGEYSKEAVQEVTIDLTPVRPIRETRRRQILIVS